MKRCASGVAAAVLVLGLGACNSDDGEPDEPSDSSSSTSSPASGGGSSAEPDTDETTDASQDEVIGKLVAGAPPSDAVWMRPEVPAGWQEMDTEAGTMQWQIADTRCLVTISQPAGLGTRDEPTNEDLADKQVQLLIGAAKVEDITDRKKGTVMMPGQVKDLDGRVEQKFTTRTFEGDGAVKFTVRARRYGDFALIAYAGCGGNEFDEHEDSIKRFLDSLAVQVTY